MNVYRMKVTNMINPNMINPNMINSKMINPVMIDPDMINPNNQFVYTFGILSTASNLTRFYTASKIDVNT